MKTSVENENGLKTKVYVHFHPNEDTNHELLKKNGVLTWNELIHLLSFNEIVALVRREIEGLTVHEATLQKIA